MNLERRCYCSKDFGNKLVRCCKKYDSQSLFKDKAYSTRLFQENIEEILALDDPFVQFYAKGYDQLEPLITQQKKLWIQKMLLSDCSDKFFIRHTEHQLRPMLTEL